MRLRIAIIAALAVAAAAAQAKPRLQDFIIAGNDGYGTAECLSRESSCGHIVADAWCETKGFRAAQSYRAAQPEDITASIGSSRTMSDAFVITCKD